MDDSTALYRKPKADAQSIPEKDQKVSPNASSASEKILQITKSADSKPETEPPFEVDGKVEQVEQGTQDTNNTSEESDELESVPLYDPEYTNEELTKKKRFYLIFLAAGYAMSGTGADCFPFKIGIMR